MTPARSTKERAYSFVSHDLLRAASKAPGPQSVIEGLGEQFADQSVAGVVGAVALS
jgi:hypothetical protein